MRRFSSMDGKICVAFGLLCLGCNNDDDRVDATVAALDALCQKVAACNDVKLSAADKAACRSMTGSLATVLVDPEYFRDCLEDLACNELEDQDKIAQCTDLDPTTLTCQDDGLLACTNGGRCSEIDCRRVCPIVGASYDSCGMSAEHGYEVCICAM